MGSAGQEDELDRKDRLERETFREHARYTLRPIFMGTLCIGHANKPKLKTYISETLLRWGPWWTIWCYGTVFTLGKTLYSALCQYFILCGVAFFLTLTYFTGGKHSLQEYEAEVASFKAASSDAQKVTPFIFGLYVSLSVGRWWAFRLKGLGIVMDSVVYLAQNMSGHSCWMHMDEHEVDRLEVDVMKVIKLGVASLQAVTQDARGTLTSLNGMVQTGLLTQEEVDLLEGSPGVAQVLWAWIGVLTAHILTYSKVPPPNQNLVEFACREAANAISRMEAYHDTQLPFVYVHMITFMVCVNNYLMSIAIGVQLTGSFLHGDLMWSSLTKELVPPFLYLLIVPPIYQALLEICILLEDPLGEDVTDFPIMMLQLRVFDTACGMFRHNRLWWTKLSPHTKRLMPAAPPPPLSHASVPGWGTGGADFEQMVAQALESQVAWQLRGLTESLREAEERLAVAMAAEEWPEEKVFQHMLQEAEARLDTWNV